MHQPSGGTQGTAADIEIQAREILYLRGKLNELYAKHTGQTVEQIERDMDRDRFMSAEEAKQYGIIDVSADSAIIWRKLDPKRHGGLYPHYNPNRP